MYESILPSNYLADITGPLVELQALHYKAFRTLFLAQLGEFTRIWRQDYLGVWSGGPEAITPRYVCGVEFKGTALEDLQALYNLQNHLGGTAFFVYKDVVTSTDGQIILPQHQFGSQISVIQADIVHAMNYETQEEFTIRRNQNGIMCTRSDQVPGTNRPQQHCVD